MIRILSVLVLALGISSHALAVDEQYFQIKKVTVRDVTPAFEKFDISDKVERLDKCDSNAPLRIVGSEKAAVQDPASALGAIEVFVDQIINIGKKIWAIVDAGRPVVNIRIDSANALPRGVTCWSDLAGWQAPQSKVYNVQYENSFGMVVIDYSYRVTFTAGGSVDGVGKYLTNATFMPANVEVAWGFDLAADAQVPSVFNMASKQDPVAGMQMNMHWTVKSPVSHMQATETFFVTGKNELSRLE